MNIKQVLTEHPDLRRDLFIRGFLVTDRADVDTREFPFYGNWKSRSMEGLRFYWHDKTGAYFYSDERIALFLFGHAYNPFTMQSDEQEILQRLAEHWEKDFFVCLDELTGIFVLGILQDGVLSFVTDASGIQSACCGMADGHFYFCSHAQLIGDVCGLETDAFVKQLTAYKWYGRILGPYLPADLTPFACVKRVVPNQIYTFDGSCVSHKRFYPTKGLAVCDDADAYGQTVGQCADILHRSMQLVVKKWERPQISLTGGIDSNTTFAAANGMYGDLETFSYLAADKEDPDCEAAKRISDRFGLPWTLYRVPADAAKIPLYDQRKAVLMHNNGYVASTPDHELRKRMVLRDRLTADVEVKSWVSETTRAYWYKYFHRKTMPALSPRLFRNLYKLFLLDRRLVSRVDDIFAAYIRDYEYEGIDKTYLPADLHYWEVACGSFASLNISEMKYYADITIIYNNRRLLDLMLSVPLEERVSDQHHLDIKQILNKDLWEMGIRVVNKTETDLRARLLGTAFAINSHLPF